MGYIEIPKINVLLPIYHGVSSGVLSKGIGHLPETSLYRWAAKVPIACWLDTAA